MHTYEYTDTDTDTYTYTYTVYTCTYMYMCTYIHNGAASTDVRILPLKNQDSA